MTDPVLTDGEPCGCSECVAAGVEHEPVRAVPYAGLIHGWQLKKFVLARAAFFAEAKRLGYPVPKEWR